MANAGLLSAAIDETKGVRMEDLKGEEFGGVGRGWSVVVVVVMFVCLLLAAAVGGAEKKEKEEE